MFESWAAMSMGVTGESFNAGQKVPTSGVYKVIHTGQHTQPHYVIALYGNTFPSCRECGGKVVFELAISAIHVNAHPLFVRNHR